MTLMPFDPDRLNELHDRAHADAEVLRREALDDLWRGANAALATAGSQALRTARRLAYRMQRHRVLAGGEV